MTIELAISLLAAAGSFIGAVIVVTVKLGRTAERIEVLSRDVDLLKVAKEQSTTAAHTTALLAKDVEAMRDRFQREHGDLKASLDRLHDEMKGLTAGVYEIRAAMRAANEGA